MDSVSMCVNEKEIWESIHVQLNKDGGSLGERSAKEASKKRKSTDGACDGAAQTVTEKPVKWTQGLQVRPHVIVSCRGVPV